MSVNPGSFCTEDGTKTTLQSGDLLFIEVNHGLLSVLRGNRRLLFKIREQSFGDDKLLIPYAANIFIANHFICAVAMLTGLQVERERADDVNYIFWRVL